MIKCFLNEQQTHVIGQDVASDSDLQDKQTSRILRSGQSFNRANKEFAVLPDFRYPLDFRWHKQGTWLSSCTNTEPCTSRLLARCTDSEAPDAASTFGSIPAGFMSLRVLMVPNNWSTWRWVYLFQFSHHRPPLESVQEHASPLNAQGICCNAIQQQTEQALCRICRIALGCSEYQLIFFVLKCAKIRFFLLFCCLLVLRRVGLGLGQCSPWIKEILWKCFLPIE